MAPQSSGYGESGSSSMGGGSGSGSSSNVNNPSSNIPGPPYLGPTVKPILDSIRSPADMKSLDMRSIKQVRNRNGSNFHENCLYVVLFRFFFLTAIVLFFIIFFGF
jgi:hypothetical protein